MGVRNCGELGINLQKIVSRLLANNELVKLLYYNDIDPLSRAELTQQEKQTKIYEKLIRIVPTLGELEKTQSALLVYINGADNYSGNTEFKNIRISIDVITPLNTWIIKDSNLRPFSIIGEIQKSLDGKVINGLGTLMDNGFSLVSLTEETSIYKINYELTDYE